MDSSSEAARRTITAFIIVRIIPLSYPEAVKRTVYAIKTA